MPKCIIEIKIGDTVITLNPNSNITPGGEDFLVNTIDINKLRALYYRVKGDVSFDTLVVDKGLATQGEAIYKGVVDEAAKKTSARQKKNRNSLPDTEKEFISPMAALKMVPKDQRKAVAAYITTLDSNAVLQHGNFLLDMADSYKLSPYSHDDIKNLLFAGSTKLQGRMFNQLTAVPGMETTRISIAHANDINGTPIHKPTGVYLRPDGIVQILVPDKYYVHGAADNQGMTKANLTDKALKEVRDVMVHELTHAVYSELYISDPEFRDSIDKLHNDYTSYLKEHNKDSLHAVYNDVHEFLSDMFINKELQNSLNEVMSRDYAYESLGRAKLYQFLYEIFPKKLKESSSSLKDALAIMTDSLPLGTISDTFDKTLTDYADPSDKRNLFFLPPGVTRTDVERALSPRDQTDSWWSANAQAFRMQEDYLSRTEYNKETGQTSLKDAHYGTPINTPTAYQIDKLYGEDLALIPWLRYNKVSEQKGDWIEQGVLTKDGKPIIEGGKLKVVDVVRKGGKIVQPKDGTIIEERVRHLPVLYSNNKAQKVTLAKVGIDPSTKLAPGGYNTISVPYSLISGIRKYNWSYFDHTRDYVSELKMARTALDQAKSGKDGIEARGDRVSFYENWIERLDGNDSKGIEGSIRRATRVKSELEELYKKYSFNVTTEDGESKSHFKNITKEDYLTLGYSTKNLTNSIFATNEDPSNLPIFVAKTIKGKAFPTPNPEMFNIFWQDDIGSSFAKSSSLVAEAVVQGDMVRIHKTEMVEENGEKHTVNRYDWLPVYQKLPNGVLVGTMNGRGLIVSFNNIDAYAKNVKTASWTNLLIDAGNTIDNFKDDMWLPKEDGQKHSKSNRERVSYKPLTYDEKYWSKGDDTGEDAYTRFTENLKNKVIPLIRPGKSFVQVQRKYIDPIDKKSTQRPFVEMVLARTEDGLITLRKTFGGRYITDYVKYSDNIEDGQNYGKELLFHLEDIGKASELWKDYINEQAMFEENSTDDTDPTKKKSTWENVGTKENPQYKPLFDFKEDPRNRRDWYELYDTVSGVNISRLKEGDIIAISIKKEDSKIPYYFRKVLHVLEDGRIAVADYRDGAKFGKDSPSATGVYVKYIDPVDVAKIGYRFGKVSGTKKEGFTEEFHQDILDRRKKMVEYAQRDMDYNDFKHFSPEGAKAFNANATKKSGRYKKAIPLTNHILDPKSIEPLVYLGRELEPVKTAPEASMVEAWFSGNTMTNVTRGMNAHTTYFKGEDVIHEVKGYKKFKDIILQKFQPGDWVVTTYKNAKGEARQWGSVIDRIEGGNIYTINNDLSTSKVDTRKVVALRTSNRNEWVGGKFGKRTADLQKQLKKDGASTKASLDMDFKSPQDSKRAIYEMGNRLQALNPDIQLTYVETPEVTQILKETGFDYSNVRAFVKDGGVYVNTDKASISDMIHEYGHLFLHGVKYDNPALYGAIIQSARVHPLYDSIAAKYPHLTERSDIDEEAFMTLLGEYMKGQLSSRNQARMDDNKQVVHDFASYTKSKLESIMDSNGEASDITPKQILNMRLEDVMQMVGDNIMKNRINTDADFIFERGRDIEQLTKDLKKRGLLTEECYG